tara:strand:+ start:1626 stop:2405 length:780 start_codon:yes stop_codon:yes gene_type:complete
MKICVLMKQVPDKDSSIKISMDNLSIDENIVSFATNESDSYALEEALQIKEKLSGEVVAITFGKESSTQVIKDALAKGADRAIFVNNDGMENFDILSIGKVLSQKLKEEKFDLILSGLQSDDDGNAQLGLILAELLDMSHGSLVMGTEIESDKSIKVKRELENGWFQWSDLDFPASISIQSGINTPRYASLKGIMAMKKKTIDKFSKDDFDLSNIKPKVTLESMYIPQKTKTTEYIDGSPTEIAEKLIDIFTNDIKVIG